jgi:O-antigen/teichoic acid export membrane protein
LSVNKIIKIKNNLQWLFADNFTRILIGFLVGVWLARYLGAQQLGILNFSYAFVTLFMCFSTLGLNGIATRDIINQPKNTGKILGTMALLQIIGGIFAYILIIIFVIYLSPNDLLTQSIAAIIGAISLFKFSEISVFFFEAKVKFKYVAIPQSIVGLIFLLIKIILILQEASLKTFAWTILCETILISLILLINLNNKFGPLFKKLSVNIKLAKKQLKDSFPFILIGLSLSVLTRIDQIMLGKMLNIEMVGIFSIATRFSEFFYFFLIAILTTYFPYVIAAKKVSKNFYYASFQKFFDLAVVIGLVITLFISFFSKPLMTFIYGEEYSLSGTVLAIHIWSLIFVYLGMVSSKWLIIGNLQIFILYRVGTGALLNIVLNFFLIPTYGVVGAAVAGVLSHIVMDLIFDVIQEKTRKIFFMKINALNLIGLIKRNKLLIKFLLQYCLKKYKNNYRFLKI